MSSCLVCMIFCLIPTSNFNMDLLLGHVAQYMGQAYDQAEEPQAKLNRNRHSPSQGRCGVNTTIMTTSSATTTFVSSTTTTSATETRTSFTSTKTTKTTSLAPVTFTGTTVHSQSTTDIEDQTEKECNPFSGWRYLSFKSCAQVELDLGKGT